MEDSFVVSSGSSGIMEGLGTGLSSAVDLLQLFNFTLDGFLAVLVPKVLFSLLRPNQAL